MISFSTNLIGADTAISGLERMRDGAEGVQRQVVGDLGAAYLAALKGETPRGRGEDSPQLVRNYEVEQHYSRDNAQYSIRNETHYLRWVIRGRKAVVAKPGKMLRFTIDGKVFYRKRVKAAKANNFPKRVRAKMRGEVAEAKRRIAALLIARFRG